MIAAYENLIAACTSACLRGDVEEASRIYHQDLSTAVDVELRKGTEDAVSAGLAAKKRMEEVWDAFFPPPPE